MAPELYFKSEWTEFIGDPITPNARYGGGKLGILILFPIIIGAPKVTHRNVKYFFKFYVGFNLWLLFNNKTFFFLRTFFQIV